MRSSSLGFVERLAEHVGIGIRRLFLRLCRPFAGRLWPCDAVFVNGSFGSERNDTWNLNTFGQHGKFLGCSEFRVD